MRDLMDVGKVGMLNPDEAKCGGMTEAKKIAALAQACSRTIKPHNTRPNFSTAAALHFMASISNAASLIEFPDVDKFRDQLNLMRLRVEFKNGYLLVPQTPGLGIEPDETAVKRAIVN